MRKDLLGKLVLLIAFNFTLITQLSATPGANGAIKLTLNTEEINDTTELHVNVGTSVTLKADISGITSGSPNGSCKYSITIPQDILNADGSPLSSNVIEKNHSKDVVETYGPYTAKKSKSYKFDPQMEVGDKVGTPIVYFHPFTPQALDAANVNPLGFTANWESAEGAEWYAIELANEVDTLRVDNISGLSYEFKNLASSTLYSYTIKSKGEDNLYSFIASNSISVTTTIRPVLSSEPEMIQPFNDFVLGTEIFPTQSITIAGTDLYGDIVLKLEGTENNFSINKVSIEKDAEDKSVIISFNPGAAGNYQDTLIISSIYAEDISIPLEGNASVGIPEALAATDEKSFGFTANWNSVPYATSYILTVSDKHNNPLEDYNNLNVDNVTAYEVTNLLPNSTYTYTVKAVNNGLSSDASNIITVTTIDGAVITYSKISPFLQEVNSTASKTIRVKGTNLTEKIDVSISNGYFSIDKTELDADGGSVVITYTPTEVGEHESILTLSSAMAQDVLINLKGTSIPLSTTTLPATDITLNSFTANWNPTENASDYLLTVKQGADIIFEDKSSEGNTSLLISELPSGKSFTYSVKVVENNQVSAISDIAQTYTFSAPTPGIITERTALHAKWTALPEVTNYKITLYDGENAMEDYNQLVITDNEYYFSGLEMNSIYYLEVVSVYGEKQFSSGRIETKTNSDYGVQLRNPGFEYWEGSDKSIEPTNWNSFMTAEGSQTSGISGGFVKVQKVRESNIIRPYSTGLKSAVINSTKAAGVEANGNLTTGQIQANSMTPKDPTNHNKTLTGNDNFNAPFTGTPDTLTVWVKYVPKNSSDMARVAAAIHGDYDYRDPSGSDPQAEKQVVAKATLDYPTVENNNWQRLSIPFEYTANKIDPAFMLVSFTTNKSPGEGSENDSVYIDDILMIYKPVLTMGKPNKSKYIIGETITIPYTLTGTMSPTNLNAASNIAYLELSDENGSFDNAQVIAQRITDTSGEFAALLPDNITLSSNYKVRVVTTNYPMISNESDPFSILQIPNAPVATEATGVTAASFVANWETVESATGYLLIVGEQEIVIQDGETTSYEVKNLTPETDYSYTVKTIVDGLYSEASNIIYVKTKDGGSILYTGNTTFSTNTGISKTETLTISGEGLIGDIYIDFTENETGFFVVNKNELTVEGGDIEITYTPGEIGIHTATIRFQSTFVDDLSLTLTGTSYPLAVDVSEAEDITPVSFKARWESSDEAEAYLLTIMDQDKNILPGYENINVGNETSKLIESRIPETIYYYTVKVLANSLESEASNEKSVKTLKKPQISNEITVKEFLQNLNIKDSDTILIQGIDLFGEGKINLQLNGSEYFKINKQEVVSGEKLAVVYEPAEAGIHNGQIVLSAEYADDVTITIKGSARPLPVLALPAQNTTLSSFVACWEASADADAYLLTVKNNTGVIVEDYNSKNVGNITSLEVTGLQRLRNYTYYVEVFKNEVASEASNIIQARTSSPSDLNIINSGQVKLYPNPATSYIYIEGTQNGQEYVIVDTQGILVQKGHIEENKISIENLMPNLYIIQTEGTNLRFIKE